MSGQFASEVLEGSRVVLAGFAATRLLESHPETAARFGADSFAAWRSHMEQRIRELSAALAADRPELFLDAIDWNRRAFAAREVPEQDLHASLECLGQVLAEELPDRARAKVDEAFDAALRAFEAPPSGDELGPDPATPTGKLALRYMLAVLEGDRREAAVTVLGAVDRGEITVRQAYLDVLLPAQREAGRLWHADEMSVAEEHFVTATTAHVMSLLAHRAERVEPNGKTVVAASVTGDVHDVGIRVVADFFEMAGWRVVYLGADLPIADVPDAARHFDADLFVLSTTLSTQLGALEAMIRVLRRGGDGPKILIGGRALRAAPDLWKRLDADGYAADAPEAVEVGARLVGL